VKTVECKVKTMQGKDAGTLDLNPEVFAAPLYKHLVHQVVRWQLAKRRAGTHDVLTRSEMKGGKKKPFAQKGTGRARAGSSISPLWVGGAVVHGPTPRSYEFKVPREIRRKALCSALSSKIKNEQLIVLDELKIKSGKTSEMAELIKKVGATGSALLITVGANDEMTHRSAKNLDNITTMSPAGVNVYDLIKHTYLIVSKEALKAIEARGQCTK